MLAARHGSEPIVARIAGDGPLQPPRRPGELGTGSGGGFLEFRFRVRGSSGDPPAPLRRVDLQVDGGPAVVTASLWGRPTGRYELGAAGGKLEIETDALSELRIEGGPLRIERLCIVPVAAGATDGWEAIPGLPYPLTLPLTHPDYPAASAPERLDDARQLCRDRVHYRRGDTARVRDALSPPPRTLSAAGAVTVEADSPVVLGQGTQWDDSLTGGVLRVDGEETGYTVLSVLRSDRLLLTRPHPVGARGAPYRIDEDPTGQLHDTLALLLAGGPGAGPMPQRVLPRPVAAEGELRVERDAADRPRKVVGDVGVSWPTDLEGLALRLVEEDRGTLTATAGSDRVGGGPPGGWRAAMAGRDVEIGDWGDTYRIAGVDAATGELVLASPYRGESAAGLAYAVYEPFAYRIEQVVGPRELRLERDYVGPLGTPRGYAVTAPFGLDGGRAPAVPRQRPLELVLTAALHPGIAQMLGLAWVDGKDHGADPGERYDYLIMADRDGTIGRLLDEVGSAEELAPLLTRDFKNLEQIDGWIVFDRRIGRAPPLSAPDGGEAFALPPRPAPAGADPLRQNVAGLRWSRTPVASGAFAGLLGSGRPVLHHLWRQRLEREPRRDEAPDKAPPADTLAEDDLATRDHPLVLTRTPPPTDPPSGWPAFGLDYLDLPLPDGWYSYRLSGVDIFGRHTSVGAPFRWRAFEPGAHAPDAVRNPFAVLLRDDRAPGVPTGVEGTALDPRDPFLVRDEAYEEWRGGLTGPDARTRVGLRVEWRWTEAQERAAPDVSHFRIHHQSGRLNAFPGEAGSATPLDADASEVEVVLLDAPGPGIERDALRDAWLRRGPDAFRVVGNGPAAGNTVRVRVAHGPPVHALGELVSADGARVEGRDTSWAEDLAGGLLVVAGELHRVTAVESPTQLTLESAPGGIGDGAYGIVRAPAAGEALTLQVPARAQDGSPHPAHVDYRSAGPWDRRLAEVALGDPRGREIVEIAPAPGGGQLSGLHATDAGGAIRLVVDRDAQNAPIYPDLSAVEPGRHWLALGADGAGPRFRITGVDAAQHTVTVAGSPSLAAGGSAWRVGQRVRAYTVFLDAPGEAAGGAFHPTPERPSVFASLGVSAVDDRANESDVGGPAKVVRVLREPPPAPAAPLPREGKAFATPADYHGRSFHTFRWPAPPGGAPYRVHVHRAMERSVFQRDLLIRRTRRALDPADPVHARRCFPDGLTLDPDEIAGRLNRLEPKGSRAAGLDQYRTWLVHDDDWRVLAALPGNAGVVPQGALRPDALSALDPADRAALLDRVAERDYEVRLSRAALAPGDPAFPDQPRWGDVLRLDPESGEEKPRAAWVAERLNAIRDEADYWTLPLREDAWQVLANLPGNEAAFSQVTRDPLDPSDPATANRRGPDDPAGFAPGDPSDPMADPGLRIYVDTLDGRSSNAYLYRARYLDAVQNRGALGLAGRPVHLPVTEPPRAPRPTKVRGGERCIRLRLAPTREAHAELYAVYRSAERERTRDLRLMGEPVAHLLVHPRVARRGTVAFDPRVEAGVIERVYDAAGFDPDADPLSQPGVDQWLPAPIPVPAGGLAEVAGLAAPEGAEVVVVYRDRAGGVQHTPRGQRPREWADHAVPPLRDHFYRIVAVGSRGQRSRPSRVVRGRAFDPAPPSPPVPAVGWTDAEPPAARITWSASHETRLERAPSDGAFWAPVGDWRAAGSLSVDDPVDPDTGWRYRVRARTQAGLLAVGETVSLAARGVTP